MLGFDRGAIPEGLSAAQSAKAELKEETGYGEVFPYCPRMSLPRTFNTIILWALYHKNSLSPTKKIVGKRSALNGCRTLKFKGTCKPTQSLSPRYAEVVRELRDVIEKLYG